MKKRRKVVFAFLILLVLMIGISLFLFPFYRLAQVRYIFDYYAWSELALAAYAGSSDDRAAVQPVLELAEQAFSDCLHTQEENQKAYGLLARYATPKDRNAVSTSCSLELWSAHLGAKKGVLWVCYSNEAVDSQGEIVRGSWDIPSLWRIAKDSSGNWAIADIKEHP